MFYEILVSINHTHSCFHWNNDQHIACYVRDCGSDEFIQISFYKKVNPPLEVKSSAFVLDTFEGVKASRSHVSFYINTDKTLHSFCDLFNEEFLKTDWSRLHNCAHAVNYALNFYSPLPKKPSLFRTIKNGICCCLCISTGGCNCFSSKLRTPHEVLKKAEKIKKKGLNVIPSLQSKNKNTL